MPQGSILSPVLFLLYINDLGDQVSVGSTVTLFADDAKLFRLIRDFRDCLILQKDLGNLLKWSNTWKLHFSAVKCKCISSYIFNIS